MKERFDEQASISVAESATPAAASDVAVGERITYTFALAGAGHRYVDNVVVTDSLPAATDLITYSVTRGSIAAGGGVVTATIGRLYPTSGTITVTLVGAVAPSAVGGTSIENRAFVKSEPVITVSDVVTHRVAGSPALTLAKSAPGGAPALAGGELAYTIVVSNVGSAGAAGVLVSDTLPVETSFVTASLPHLGPVGGVITWPLGVVGVGYTRSVTLVVRVHGSVISGTYVSNTAWVAGDGGAAGSDTVSTRVAVAADLAVAKLAHLDPVLAGGTLTYSLVYTNVGPSDAAAVFITDTLPLSVTYGGPVSQEPSITGPVVKGRTLTWYTPTLAAGVSGTIVFTVTVDAGATGTVTNAAVITGATPDPDAGSNEADEATQLVSDGLIVDKTALDVNGVPLYERDEIAYSIVATSTCDQADVILADPLPANVSLVAGSVECTPGANCGMLGGVYRAYGGLMGPEDFGGLVFATTGSLGAGEVLTLAFRARVQPGVSTIGGNVAVVQSSSQPEAVIGPVYPGGDGVVEPGLTVGKTALDVDGAPLRDGDVIEYSIVVSNTNPTYAQSNVTISDTVVTSTTLVIGSVSCTAGAICDAAGNLVTGTIPSLGPGSALTMTFRVLVDQGARFVGGNVAAVESDNQNEQRAGQIYPLGGGRVFFVRRYLPFVMRDWPG
jgi:uncharacterized repeat protein (TIGR01451 family)